MKDNKTPNTESRTGTLTSTNEDVVNGKHKRSGTEDEE